MDMTVDKTLGIEDPPEDVAEQHMPAMPSLDDDELDDVTPEEVPWDADMADVAEQRREVPVEILEPDLDDV